MHRGYTTPLVIAIMAFAIVAFLFLIDTAIMPANSNQTTNRTANKNADDVACTTEAKLCPDGSAVGRSGPTCEFAECPASTNTNSVTSSDKESTDVVDAVNKNLHTYTSYKLGVQFNYLSSADNKNGILEKDNRIYVYYINADGSSKPEEGQWIEAHAKSANESLANAISGKFLKEYSTSDCYVKTVSAKPTTWEFAGIGYPIGDGDNDWIENSAKCPTSYTASNWIGYFGMDTARPEQYYFFSIGQYAIPGTNDQTPWQDTIKTVRALTADWKTYSAPTAKYSFQYPNGLGNAEIQGMMYVGGLDDQKAKEWEANLAVIDSDKETQVVYIYAPLQSDEPGTTLPNMIPGSWKNPTLYTKSSQVINGTSFDKYVAIGTPDNYVREGYAVTKAGRHYILSLMDAKIDLARTIVSTFTISD